ncbi:hypothetical protein AVEN_6130-1 [Araneus ventricosus]|uniref:Uncharacterized protein n=1 Tax=Araneus ventricosus TaxID=182803 RepID=A0A4Y2G3T0_ARAVE|nr:hypothetical protein AVEN_6130-1 [Araneus ventricosus]
MDDNLEQDSNETRWGTGPDRTTLRNEAASSNYIALGILRILGCFRYRTPPHSFLGRDGYVCTPCSPLNCCFVDLFCWGSRWSVLNCAAQHRGMS